MKLSKKEEMHRKFAKKGDREYFLRELNGVVELL